MIRVWPGEGDKMKDRRLSVFAHKRHNVGMWNLDGVGRVGKVITVIMIYDRHSLTVEGIEHMNA